MVGSFMHGWVGSTCPRMGREEHGSGWSPKVGSGHRPRSGLSFGRIAAKAGST